MGSEGSYYSESEYSLHKEEWGKRFWGRDIYNRLLKVKKTWDPEHVFSCRHCIGDGETALPTSEETLPTCEDQRPRVRAFLVHISSLLAILGYKMKMLKC